MMCNTEDTLKHGNYTEDVYDEFISAEFLVSQGGEMVRGTVVKRAKGEEGTPIGTRYENPITCIWILSTSFSTPTPRLIDNNKILRCWVM